jgi:hypothetical protein
VSRYRASVAAALEALAAGDQAEAERILLDLLQEAPRRGGRYACPYCGCRFEWPGLRDAHLEHCGRRPPLERSATVWERVA